MPQVDDLARCSRDELAAVHRRFEAMAGRWMVTQEEAAALLGQADWRDAGLTSDAETRMRLLLDVDGLLDLILGEGVLADWVRTPNVAFVGQLTPLEAMSKGAHATRGMRNVLEDIGGSR